MNPYSPPPLPPNGVLSCLNLPIMDSLKTEKQAAMSHRQGGGVGVEDVDPELPQRFLEDNVHHGVLLTVLGLQVGNLEGRTPFKSTKAQLMKCE